MVTYEGSHNLSFNFFDISVGKSLERRMKVEIKCE